jgi:hypothetical protein
MRSRGTLSAAVVASTLSVLVVGCTPLQAIAPKAKAVHHVVATKAPVKPTAKPAVKPATSAAPLPAPVVATPLPSAVVPTSDANVTDTAVSFAADVVDNLAEQKGTLSAATSTTPVLAATTLSALPFRPTLTCARCNSGPAVAAAAIYAVDKDPNRLAFATESIDLLIQAQHHSNGALSNDPTVGADVETMFDADNIGMATLLLKPSLDPAHLASWTATVSGAADYLINNGNVHWYTNGNIVVGNTLTFALAYKLTGLAKYQTAYSQMLSFAVSPPQTGMWAGYGFVTTKQSTAVDGSDGAGFFTEAGGADGVFRVGYDPDYTMLQSDQLARLYLVTRDAEVLRLLNMVTNQLMTGLNPTTGMIPGMGTRHQYQTDFFDSSAPAVLAYQGGRTDLKSLVASQLKMTTTRWGQDVRRSQLGDRGYYAIGMIPVSTIMAADGSLN